MSETGRRIATALMIAATALWAPATPAQSAPARRIVLVVAPEAGADRQDSAIAAIRGQLGDLPLEIVIEPIESGGGDLRARLDRAAQAARAQGALGAFVLELDRADDLLVYLVEPEARRALVRRIQAPGSEAAGIEELSLIVRSTSSALLEGREIGMEQGPEIAPEPARPAPPPAPAAEPVRDRRVPSVPAERSSSSGRLSAFYVGHSYAPEAGWQSGLGVSVTVSPDRRLYAGLSYAVMQAVDVDSGAASARVTRYPGELFAGYELPGDSLRVGAELGARLEVARRSTPSTAPGVEATPDETRLLWAGVARATGRLVLTDRVSIAASLGAQVYFNDSDYVVDVGGRHEPVLRPQTLRPTADLGLAVDLW